MRGESSGCRGRSRHCAKPEEFGKPAPEPGPRRITEITATVIEFAKTARGKAIFILDNGQIWRQLDADGTELALPARAARR